MDSVLASHPAAPGWNPGVPDIFHGKKFDVAEVYQRRCCLEQWLENVDRTHLVLVASTTNIKKTSHQAIFLTLTFALYMECLNPTSILALQRIPIWIGPNFIEQQNIYNGPSMPI